MVADKHDPQATTPMQRSPSSAAITKSIVRPIRDEFPPPDTARAREAAARAITPAGSGETRAAHFRRNARQGRLHGYAFAVLALVAILIALAAANTARVRVDWLLSSSRVSLVWLVLVAAIIGWILGVLASARFQWLTRAPRPKR
jgi:uncharacterized integral membrane protein